MTETVSDEKIVISSANAPVKENIVVRKTIVYETLVDPTVVRVASEKLKQQLFTKLGLLKPKSEEIQFISIDKYYEPYIIVSGKYTIDHYRKCNYKISVDKDVLEVILFEHRFVPERSSGSPSRESSIIKLEGEERLVNENKASFIIDRYGRNVALGKIPSAPSEKNPKKVISKFEIEEIPQNGDVDYVRSKLVKRPDNVNRIVSEIFEVAERVVVYTPQFRILYKNLKTGEEKALEFDGVTSERIQQSRGAISKGVQIIRSRFR